MGNIMISIAWILFDVLVLMTVAGSYSDRIDSFNEKYYGLAQVIALSIIAVMLIATTISEHYKSI